VQYRVVNREFLTQTSPQSNNTFCTHFTLHYSYYNNIRYQHARFTRNGIKPAIWRAKTIGFNLLYYGNDDKDEYNMRIMIIINHLFSDLPKKPGARSSCALPPPPPNVLSLNINCAYIYCYCSILNRSDSR